MHARRTILWMLTTLAPAASAMADDATRMTTMENNEVIAVMPDGQMAKAAVTDAAKLEDLKKIGKPIPWCMMFMKSSDGRVYMIDTSAHVPMGECENMVQ